MITRRETVGLMAAAAATAWAGIGPAFAQNVDVAQLMEPGPLGDIWQGPEGAKVTIVEYASLTCNHCAAFHNTTYTELKKRYIDTGQVRFTLREFPLNQIDTALYMVARSDPAKYYPITDLLFETQASWLREPEAAKVLASVKQLLRQAGISDERFNQILKDQKLLDGVNASRTRAADVFKVDSTPTFFINGKRHQGNNDIESFEKTIKPILGA
ncbi:DsbA family protein [Enterovirga rhinocerotis]|uniref:Protein-disulfide isomerase n=1 Tax=Enterovirga rhinocerotis TaxID=1339210 RepID=A0A4R7C9Z6_9HYPH|nr:DsbA family protein [Enterovirga rhinocerotis]TDR93776.1 protein-disulfide isomerase [Enterovirga rhinocerotis]